ncbi:MAG: cbb3-type cytochrome c oxidase subunit 3 [Devosiaceae bacterium]|nr:cbb3-type cytochrome c oxidase subunit 3 [Devosiaceae bacterium MH13]
MSAEALVGYAEAGFVLFGFIALAVLLLRVMHPSSTEAMNDHANIPFRGEDAPEPRSTPQASRQNDHG